jgi:hypothetical protein
LRATNDFGEKRSKSLTWFNLGIASAGTKAGVEEDEEEAASGEAVQAQRCFAHEERMAG